MLTKIRYSDVMYGYIYYLLPIKNSILLAREILRYFRTKSYEDVGARMKTKESEFSECVFPYLFINIGCFICTLLKMK